MKKLIALTLAAVAAIGFYNANVVAQPFTPAPTPVFAAVADDTSIAFLVRYVGSNTSATVAVDAGTGDLTFQVGGVAYTGFECPVVGGLGGIIDVSNAACDTVGKVVDHINGNCTGCSSDFRAVVIDGLRSDSSNDTFLSIGATQVTRTDGLQINYDTDVALHASYALVPNRTNIAGYLSGPPSFRLLENPHAGQTTSLKWFEAKSTYGAGTSNFNVYSVKQSNKVAGSSVVTTLWGPEAGGATTATKQFSQFQNVLLPGRKGEKLIVRLTNSNAMATTGGFASGQVQ